MRLGICTRYDHHEAAYAALRVADAAEAAGHDVSLMTMTERPAMLNPKWDRVLRRSYGMVFTEWSWELDHVLWTTIPHIKQVEWINERNLKTSIVVLWHELSPYNIDALVKANHAICPTRACYKLLGGAGLPNCAYVPWDGGMPIYKKPKNHCTDHPKLFVPFWDGNVHRTEMTTLDIIVRALQRHTTATVTMAFNASTISSAAKKKIVQIKKMFPSRFQYLKSVKPCERPMLFQSHDLTIWPTHLESTSMTGLHSIELGTPVIAFSFRPTCEILTPNNSISVGCPEVVNDLGVPRAIPDYDIFDEMLHHALRDTEFIHQLQTTTRIGIDDRRIDFQSRLCKLLI